MRKYFIVCTTVLQFFALSSSAQTYTPIAVTGFNHDVVAETYPSSLATTDTVLDGSSYVIYSQAFASSGGFLGGLPNNGIIQDAAAVHRYQLNAYNSNNALFVLRNTNRVLSLNTAASYQKLSILAFSTEGSSLFNVVVEFTDGSSTSYVTNATLSDWFNATGNLVISGYGRVTRLANATAVDGPTTNPRMYFVDFNLNCVDKKKLVQRVRFSNTTTAGTNAPFPNAVVMAVSGQSYSQTVSTSIVQPSCGSANGSATITVTGNAGPFTYSWNTVPVQTGITASNLAGGNYTVTVTDAAGCATAYPVNIAQQASIIQVTTSATPATICAGSSAQLNVSATGGSLATINWTPGNFTSATVSVSPASTTLYTVNGLDAIGCPYSSQVSVTVNPRPVAPVVAAAQGCQGSSVTLQVNSPQTNYVYNWYTAPTGGTLVGTGSNFTANNVQNTTTYYAESQLNACTSPVRTPVVLTVFPSPLVNAGTDRTIIAGDAIQLQATAANGTYLWSPSTGLSATNILNPVATPLVTTTYNLKVTNGQNCSANDQVLITVVPYCVKPMEAFTPNGDGINDLWLVTNGNCLTSARVEIFNRYGNSIFKSEDYKNNWNGEYKGKPVADGTYYFLITYQLINGKTVYLKGNVTVLR
jgi:gliding motility-associated-like protein